MSRRLASVPESPRRALGLIRVSKERDGMISPELQRAAIEDYTRRRGYRITEWREGIDESGSKSTSAWWPRLNDAIGLVENGSVDVIVVWKYSRTARHRLRWAVALDRVETAGGTIESATEEIDTTTATGRFTRGMLAEMAAFEAERIGDTWKETLARRRSLGLPHNTRTRYGYRYDGSMFVPDPETAPVLASLYRRFVNGESHWQLVAWLNSNGYKTNLSSNVRRGDGSWSMQSLRRMMERGFAAGLIWHKGEFLPGAHEPLIDRSLWEAYLAAKKGRAVAKRSERSSYPFTNLARCAIELADGSRCGAPMTGGHSDNDAKYANYSCTTGRSSRKHSGGYVSERRVEAVVLAWLRELAADVDETSQQVAERAKAQARRVRDAAAIAREIIELDRQLSNATRQYLRDIIPESAYEAVTAQISAEKQQLQLQHAEAVEAAKAPTNTQKVAADLLEDWGDLAVGEKRAVLRTLIRRIDVVSHRVSPDIRVVPLWE